MDIVLYYLYTTKHKGVKKYDSQKYIKWTLDPAKSCLVPEAL